GGAGGQRGEDEDDGGAAGRPDADPLRPGRGRRGRPGGPAGQPGAAERGVRDEPPRPVRRRPRAATADPGAVHGHGVRRRPAGGRRSGHRGTRGGRDPAGRLRRDAARGGARAGPGAVRDRHRRAAEGGWTVSDDRISQRFQLSYGDCDVLGISYFAIYYPWMERTYSTWLYTHGIRSGHMVDDLGVLTVGISSGATYVQAAKVFDEL